MFFGIALLFILTSVSTFANEISLYITSPVKELNWETPRSFALSVSINSLVTPDYPMGHAQVAIRCTGGKNQGREIYSGMTSADSSEGKKLLYEDKIGFGIFLHSFKGRLETQEEVLFSMNQCDPNRPKHSLGSSRDVVKFKVSEEQCNQAVRFFDDFKSNKRDEKLGLLEQPLCEGSGAGNGNFIAAFAMVARLLSPEDLASWKRKVLVPHKYIGSKENPVDPYRFLLMGNTEWGANSFEGQELEFFDPPLMAKWIRSQTKYRRSGKCRIVDLDARDAQRMPASFPILHCPKRTRKPINLFEKTENKSLTF